MDETTKVIAEHYQKTYELAYENWQKRNRAFLFILGLVAVEALLAIQPDGGLGIVFGWLSAAYGVTVDSKTFSVGLIYTVLLVALFYLIVNLYHRTVTLLRLYAYIEELEKELRSRAGLGHESVAFTRESTFYRSASTWGLRTVRYAYAILLGGLLLIFLGYTLWTDYATGAYPALVAHSVVGLAILTYFWLYAIARGPSERERRLTRRCSGRSTAAPSAERQG